MGWRYRPCANPRSEVPLMVALYAVAPGPRFPTNHTFKGIDALFACDNAGCGNLHQNETGRKKLKPAELWILPVTGRPPNALDPYLWVLCSEKIRSLAFSWYPFPNSVCNAAAALLKKNKCVIYGGCHQIIIALEAVWLLYSIYNDKC